MEIVTFATLITKVILLVTPKVNSISESRGITVEMPWGETEYTQVYMKEAT